LVLVAVVEAKTGVLVAQLLASILYLEVLLQLAAV